MQNKFDELTKSLAQSVTRRTALKRFGLGLAGMALACFGLSHHSLGAPTFTAFDFPGAVLTTADNINAIGQITGRYVDAAGKTHGFIRDGDNYTSIDFPGAPFTSVYGINNGGDIVGRYTLKEVGADKDARGYLLRDGVGIAGCRVSNLTSSPNIVSK